MNCALKETGRLLARGLPALLVFSFLVHGLQFHLLIFYADNLSRLAWAVAILLAVYPLRVSLFNTLLHNADKDTKWLETLGELPTPTSFLAQFLNNFLWWGYVEVVFFIASPLLPEPPLGIHCGLILLALTCVPAAFVDCNAQFLNMSFGSAFKDSWRRVGRRPFGIVLAYVIFWEGFNELLPRVEQLLRPFFDDPKALACAALTLTLSPLYVLLWTYIYAEWKTSSEDDKETPVVPPHTEI